MCEIPRNDSEKLKIKCVNLINRVCKLKIFSPLYEQENPFLVYVTAYNATGSYNHDVLYYKAEIKNFVDNWVPLSNIISIELADPNEEILYKIKHDI